MHNSRLRLTLFSLTAALFAIPFSSFAELSIEQAVRGTEMPSNESILGDRRPAKEERAKEGSSVISPESDPYQRIFVKKLTLAGVASLDPAAFAPVLEKYENSERSLAELQECAKDLEREYLRQGVIAAVFVPPQELSDGNVTLQVVEARMGELEITKARYFNGERLRNYWRVPAGSVMRYDEISRGLQTMNKNPDRKVKASLHAGKTPGTTDVQIDQATAFPLHFGASYDREGGTATGRERFGATVRHNNFLGLDDSFFAGYIWGAHFNGKYAYHLIPVGDDGMSVLYGYSRSDAWPKKEFTPYGIHSKSENYSVSLRKDLFSGQEYIGEAYTTLEAKERTIVMRRAPYNRDRLRIVHGGAKAYSSSFGGSSSISGDLAQGFPGILGASDVDNPMASRGAHSDFTRLSGEAQHRVMLPMQLQALFKAGGQVSSTKLPTSETYVLGGIDSVRGYPAGDYSADNAFAASSELLIPATLWMPGAARLPYARQTLGEATQGVIFVDYAHGDRRQAAASEKKSADMLGAGAGVRVNLYDQGLLRLEWGFPLLDEPLTESGHSRFHISLEFQEKLPAEIARIHALIDDRHADAWAWKLVDSALIDPDSPLRSRLVTQLLEARAFRDNGDLRKERQSYTMLVLFCRSLYSQARDYVKEFMALRDRLEEMERQANQCFREGKYAQARELWQQVVTQAKIKQAMFSY